MSLYYPGERAPRVRVVTEPPVEPVTLTQIKDHLRISITAQDAILGTYIAAARKQIDGPTGWLGRALVQQTLEMQLDYFPPGGYSSLAPDIFLPCPPFQSLTSISYIDTTGASQSLSLTATSIQVDGDDPERHARIAPAYGVIWPSTRAQYNAVTVRWVAGFALGAGSPTDYTANIPDPIKVGIMLLVGSLFENRETEAQQFGAGIQELPHLMNFLMPYRREWF